jgi:hypothetical protein
MDVYWSKCARGRNFGDVLGPLLVEHFTGDSVEWKTAEDSQLVVIGSILEHLPARYTGTVAGIGKANRKTRRDLRSANVVCLRGPLTSESVLLKPGDQPLLGDPGLLAPDLLGRRPEVTNRLGIVKHYLDTETPVPPDALEIDVLAPVLDVVAAIGSCERIITSSLHGLIVADAFNIPRMWVPFSKVQGRGLKFTDYAAAFGTDLTPGTWGSLPERTVAARQANLREVLSCLPSR